MAHNDVVQGGVKRMKGKLANGLGSQYLHTTSKHDVSSITTADAHAAAASSRLNWRPRRFKWTRPFRRKTKSGFCACVITFQLSSTSLSEQIPSEHKKQSLYRPGHAMRFPGASGSQISKRLAFESGKVVSPKTRQHLPPPQKNFLILIYVRNWVKPRGILRSEGLCQYKIPMTPSGIENSTFRLVA
jgi:hypothetical protein